MTFQLPASARLKSRSAIMELFTSHSTRNASPLRCIYSRSESPSQVMVSVPKRLFKRAVKRNLLKRKIREAYRLNRHLLGQSQCHIAFIYTSPTECSYPDIEAAVVRLLSAARRELELV